METEKTMRILLFGDQTGDYRSTLHQIVQVKGNVALVSFFEKAYSTLREEVAQQPRAVREKLPDFTSIADLVDRYAAQPGKNNAIESVLTYISQISCFI